MPGQILTDASEFEFIRIYMGIETEDLPDSAIDSPVFLGAAEKHIINLLAFQTDKNGVASLNDIITENGADLEQLKAAVSYYVAHLFTIGETNAVDTSKQLEGQSAVLGGIGAQWQEQGEKALAHAYRALTQITNWYSYRKLSWAAI